MEPLINNTQKKCGECKQVKLLSEFGLLKKSKDGYRPTCKQCRKDKYYENHEKTLNEKREDYKRHKESRLEKCKEYYQKNAEHIKQRQTNWYNSNKNKVKQRRQTPEAKEKRKEWRSIRHQERRKTDLGYILALRLRSRIRKLIKQKSTYKVCKSLDMLGCSLKELIDHLLSVAPVGMTWEDIKDGSRTHLDHIRPCCSFRLENPEEFKECFNYKNLRPLWKADNLAKVKEDIKLKVKDEPVEPPKISSENAPVLV